FERGLDHFFGRRGDDVEGKLMPVDTFEQLRKKADIRLETNLFSGLDQMLPSDAAVFRVVQQQVRQLTTLLDEVHARQAVNFPEKIRRPDQLAENDSRII